MGKLVLKLILLLACALTCVIAHAIENSDEPLFLTNFIENGNIADAREKARVQYDGMDDVESYAGYLTINKLYNSNTFFWFFPSKNDSQNDPLIIWLQGGPGSSSLLGLFAENGPFIITGNATIKERKYSWTRNHNVIYIDNPVGAGYSFTDNDLGYARNQSDIGQDVLTAMLQFYKLFPQYQKNSFYITGESYAGKYIPAISHAIKIYNKEAQTKINLKGLAIGNGITDPINQMDRSDFFYQIGLFDSHERDELKVIEEEVRTLIRQKDYKAALWLYNTILIASLTGGPSLFKNVTGFDYHYNLLQTQKPEKIGRYVKWVQKPDVRRALHVGNRDFGKNFMKIYDSLANDLIRSEAYHVADLLEDHKVLIYNGQLDVCVPYVITDNYIKKLNWKGSKDYENVRKKQWWVRNDLAGFSKTVGNLNVVLVRNAGHFVPTDQPLWTWDMITRFTHDIGF